MHSFYLKITYTVFIWANISLSSLVNSCSQHILTGNSELMGTGTENINVDLCLLEFSSCTILHKRLIMHGETYLERWTEISDCFHLLYHIPVLNPFSFSCSHCFWGSWPLFHFFSSHCRNSVCDSGQLQANTHVHIQHFLPSATWD